MQRIDVGYGKVMELTQGDITRDSADAIVNAANSSLMGGGGVDGAIHRAGGPEILQECRRIRENRFPDGLPAGQAVATGAGHLPAKYVIHTVGPIWRGGRDKESELLASCYRQCIRLSEELELKSIAFPSISTGAYGYPIAQAAPVALAAVLEGLRAARSLRAVRFVLFDAATFQVYHSESEKLARK